MSYYCCGPQFYNFFPQPNFFGGFGCDCNNFFLQMFKFNLYSSILNTLSTPRLPQYSTMFPMQNNFNYSQPFGMPLMQNSIFNFRPMFNNSNPYNINTNSKRNNNTEATANKFNYKSASGYHGKTNEQLISIYGNYSKDATVLYKGTAEDLNKYLKGKGVLEGKGQAFIDAQNKYGVSAAVLVGITMNESGRGSSNLAKNKNNVGGVRVAGSKDFRKFNTVDECIDYMGKFIKSGYLDKGLTKLYQINARYCPAEEVSSNANWARAVNIFSDEVEKALA